MVFCGSGESYRDRVAVLKELEKVALLRLLGLTALR